MKNKISKIASVALTLILVGLMCITANASGLSGNGTKTDPYVIETAAQLNEFSEAVANGNSFSGKFIILAEDIAAAADFSPIGTENAPFSGNFNGNGKTISDFDIREDYAGVFAFTDGAVISDVSVSGEFRATDYAGAIVAFAKNTSIENCSISALVYANNYTGGVAGYMKGGKISYCTTQNKANVGSFAEYCGGIAGYTTGDITDCTNNAYTYGIKNVGGIAGYSAGNIISCTNTVAVNATKTNLGGIAGLTEGTIKYCRNTGKIETTDSDVEMTGGIAGIAYNAAISECMNNGTVSATGSFTGGIAGYSKMTIISDCIATAEVSTSGNYAGGIFGFALEGKTERCVFTASVWANEDTKAAIGAIAQGEVADCYYSSNEERAVLSGTATNTTALSAAELITEASFSSLDLENTWTINVLHATYPILVSIPYHSLELSVSTEATCTEDGEIRGICIDCNESIDKVTPAFGHSYMTVSTQAASCSVDGYRDLLCATCGETETEILPAKGHSDANADKECDVCKADITDKQSSDEEKSIFQKIADFFKSIFEWIKNLFA